MLKMIAIGNLTGDPVLKTNEETEMCIRDRAQGLELYCLVVFSIKYTTFSHFYIE